MEGNFSIEVIKIGKGECTIKVDYKSKQGKFRSLGKGKEINLQSSLFQEGDDDSNRRLLEGMVNAANTGLKIMKSNGDYTDFKIFFMDCYQKGHETIVAGLNHSKHDYTRSYGDNDQRYNI